MAHVITQYLVEDLPLYPLLAKEGNGVVINLCSTIIMKK